MGFFSWHTSDTKKSIANHYSSKKTFVVHMITENGLVYTESSYEGYGVFGGKDIYELIAEMNKLPFNNADEARLIAIDLLYKTQITNGEKTYSCGRDKKDTFWHWGTIIPQEGKTPNQLVEEGWKKVYPYGYGQWDIAAQKGIKLPKLVQKLPKQKDWKKVWDSLPYPESCEAQGYFY